MEEKLTKITEILTQVQVDIAEIRKDVNYHILRTDQNEYKIQQVADAIKPVQNHVHVVEALGKLIAWTIGLGAGIATIIAIFK